MPVACADCYSSSWHSRGLFLFTYLKCGAPFMPLLNTLVVVGFEIEQSFCATKAGGMESCSEHPAQQHQ